MSRKFLTFNVNEKQQQCSGKMQITSTKGTTGPKGARSTVSPTCVGAMELHVAYRLTYRLRYT